MHTQPTYPLFPSTDIHESDTEEIAIPFTVRFEDYLTTPGLALGVGQRINFSGNLDEITIDFDVTMGQYINLSEVIHVLPA